MRKRISVFTILCILTLLLTALVPFAQSQSDSAGPTAETAATDDFVGDEPVGSSQNESVLEAEQKSDDSDASQDHGSEEYKCETPDSSCGLENPNTGEESQQPILNSLDVEEEKNSKSDSLS